jgi:hypothetical protein
MARARRRQAGEGSISEYMTKAGPRFLIKFTAQRADGMNRVVLERGFATRKDAAAALCRGEIRRTELGSGSSGPGGRMLTGHSCLVEPGLRRTWPVAWTPEPAVSLPERARTSVVDREVATRQTSRRPPGSLLR